MKFISAIAAVLLALPFVAAAECELVCCDNVTGYTGCELVI